MQSTKNKVVVAHIPILLFCNAFFMEYKKNTIFFLILKEVNVKYIISNCIFDIFLFSYSFNKILVKLIHSYFSLSVSRSPLQILQHLIIVRRDHIHIYVSIVPEITLNCNTSYQERM